jgi:hypothetical protein
MRRIEPLRRVPDRIGDIDPHEISVERQACRLEVDQRLEAGERAAFAAVDNGLVLLVPPAARSLGASARHVVGGIGRRVGSDPPRDLSHA